MIRLGLIFVFEDSEEANATSLPEVCNTTKVTLLPFLSPTRLNAYVLPDENSPLSDPILLLAEGAFPLDRLLSVQLLWLPCQI